MERSFRKPGTKLAELEEAWPARLKDAESLMIGEQFGSAIAAGLYAVEIVLKVLICKRLDLDALPKAFEFHELDQLIILTGLSRQMDSSGDEPTVVQANWNAILTLSGHLTRIRYSGSGNWKREEAETFLLQLTQPDGGVIPWLQIKMNKVEKT